MGRRGEGGAVSDDRTIPQQMIGGVPVRDLRVDVLSGPEAGQSVISEHDPISVGMAEGNGIRLSDRTVSRYHLEVGRSGDRIALTDLGSTNGTHVGEGVARGQSGDRSERGDRSRGRHRAARQ